MLFLHRSSCQMFIDYIFLNWIWLIRFQSLDGYMGGRANELGFSRWGGGQVGEREVNRAETNEFLKKLEDRVKWLSIKLKAVPFFILCVLPFCKFTKSFTLICKAFIKMRSIWNTGGVNNKRHFLKKVCLESQIGYSIQRC